MYYIVLCITLSYIFIYSLLVSTGRISGNPVRNLTTEVRTPQVQALFGEKEVRTPSSASTFWGKSIFALNLGGYIRCYSAYYL